MLVSWGVAFLVQFLFDVGIDPPFRKGQSFTYGWLFWS